jgi:hypothetical protein
MTPIKNVLLGVIVAAALTAGSVAQSAAQTAKPCVTPADAHSVVMFALPDVVRTTMERCRPHLPASAYLIKSGGALANTYRGVANAAWAKAKPVLLKAIHQPLMRNMPDSVGKPFFGGAIGAMASERVQPTDCDTVNRAVEALAPLPPENMAILIGLIIEKEGAKASLSGRKPPLDICKPATTAVATK